MHFNETVNNLKAKGYIVNIFENKEDAALYIDSQMDDETIGIGGSWSVKEMGLYDMLKTHNTVYWHWDPNVKRTQFEIKKDAENADYYISSVNGISRDGTIVNIDGNCNRLASIIFGHKKVFFIIGENKIEKDFDSALFRARNIAAPLNAKRLNMKTPCAVNGDKCYDCSSPERICIGYSVLWSKPKGETEYEVIMIKEKLGF